MSDFGTLLPFNTVAPCALSTFQVHFLQLHEACTRPVVGVCVEFPEQWAYFVWTVQGDEPIDLGQPVIWGIVDEVPYEVLFTVVRLAPVYFVRGLTAAQESILLDLVLRDGACADWLEDAIQMRQALAGCVPQDHDFAFERWIASHLS